jgi:hypothetical protein
MIAADKVKVLVTVTVFNYIYILMKGVLVLCYVKDKRTQTQIFSSSLEVEGGFVWERSGMG